jgi:probable F420-dependent oxidoreductase
VGDRLLAPVDPSVGYGGGPGYPAQFRAALDPFVVLTVAAASTEHVGLGTNVLNAPWYPPVLLARTVAALDLVSGGRLHLGLGTGWAPEEYAAVGVPITERGSRLDDCLDVLDAWWAAAPGEPVAHEGRRTTIAPSYVDARRPQRPPVLLAGFAPRALDRVARRADAWLPVAVPGRFDPAALAKGLATVRAMAAEAGRDPKAVGAVLRVNAPRGTTTEAVADTVLTARDTAGVEEAFVDLMYLTDDTAAASGLVGEILDAVGDR